MTTTPKALSKYWHIKRVDQDHFQIECEGMATATVSTMSHEPIQMLLATMAQELIEPVDADSLASAGGVEVFVYCNPVKPSASAFRFKSKGSPAPDGYPMALVRQIDHLAALSKEREVADGLAAELEAAHAFIDEVRQDLHHKRVADWYPEGAHNAASSMSEDMRLIGNACADFPVGAALTAHRESRGGK
jgi:hypothetical protein